jgi:acyl dehydratase
VDYSAIEPGQVLSQRTYQLNADAIAGYVDAVDDRSEVYVQAEMQAVVSPMAVAALGLRGVIEELAVPAGSLHSGQELEFKREARIGDKLVCQATVLQNSVRGEWRFLVVQLSAEDDSGLQVMSGKSTLVVPV